MTDFAAFAAPRHKGLPYADHTEAQDPVGSLAAALEKHTPLDILRWESNLSDPFYRVLALDFLAHTSRNDGMTKWDGREYEGEILIEGDLHVSGNLKNAGNIVVLGDVTIDGAYVASGDYPCLNVGGNLTADTCYLCETETICLGTFKVNKTLVALRNHTVTIAARIAAGVALMDDAELVGELSSDRVHKDPGYDAELYGELFGVRDFDEDGENSDTGEHVYDGVVRVMLGD